MIGDGIGDRGPLRVKRLVRAQCDGCLVGVCRPAAVRCRVPARKSPAFAGKGVRRERGWRAFLYVLGIDIPCSAVGVKGDGVNGDQCPFCVKRDDGTLRVAQVFQFFLICVIGAGSVRCCIPAHEAVTGAFIGIRRQRLRYVIGEGLIRHAARHRVRGVGFKMHGIGDWFPPRVQRDRDVRLSGQVFNLLMHGIARAAAVCRRVPFGEAVTCTLKGISAEVPSGQNLFAVISEVFAVGCAAAAVGFIADRIVIRGPLSCAGLISGAVFDNNNGLRHSCPVIPACKGIAGADRVHQGEVVGLDGIARRIGLSLRQLAAVQLIGDRISDDLPLRVELDVILDGDGGLVGIGCTGVFRGRSSHRVPALKFVTRAGEGIFRQFLRGSIIELFGVHLAFRPDAAFAVVGDKGHRMLVQRPLRVEREVARDGDLFPVIVSGTRILCRRRGFRVPAGEAVPRAVESVRGQRLLLTLDEGLVRHGAGHRVRGVEMETHSITLPQEQPFVGVQPDNVLRVVTEEISLIRIGKGVSGTAGKFTGTVCQGNTNRSTFLRSCCYFCPSSGWDIQIISAVLLDLDRTLKTQISGTEIDAGTDRCMSGRITNRGKHGIAADTAAFEGNGSVSNADTAAHAGAVSGDGAAGHGEVRSHKYTTAVISRIFGDGTAGHGKAAA